MVAICTSSTSTFTLVEIYTIKMFFSPRRTFLKSRDPNLCFPNLYELQSSVKKKVKDFFSPSHTESQSGPMCLEPNVPQFHRKPMSWNNMRVRHDDKNVLSELSITMAKPLHLIPLLTSRTSWDINDISELFYLAIHLQFLKVSK